MAHTHAHDHPGLDVQVERTGPCLATVRFTVSADEYRKARNVGLKNFAGRSRMKGFRPGKVPPAFLEKQIGPQVDKELVEYYVQHAFQHAVDDEGLRPAKTPSIDFEAIESSNEGDWGHEFEVLLRPEVELGQVEGLEVDSLAIDVTDEELDGTLENVRREMSVPEPAGDDGLPAEGMAVCKLEFLRAGEEEPILDRDGIRLNPKTPLRGMDEEHFEKEMTGVKEGETRTFEVEFPEDFPEEEVRGTKGEVRVTVNECFRIVPPEDERVFSEFGVEDEDALRSEVRKRMLEAKDDQENQRIEQVLLEKLIEAHPMELPEPLVEEQADHKADEMREPLAAQGLEGDELDARIEEERGVARKNAAQAMRAIYLMEEIAKQHELQVSQADFESEFEAIAARNNADPTDVRKYYQEERLLQQLALELLERKVRSFLREKADIKQADSADTD